MYIQLNGQPSEMRPGATLTELLEQLKLSGKRLAVERNGEIVPRSLYAETQLQEGDILEVVHAIGGG